MCRSALGGYINGPIPPLAVESNSSITAVIYPDDTTIGEPGIVVPALGTNRVPTQVFCVLSGRGNAYSETYWNTYADYFRLRLYSADPQTGYLAYAAPFAEIPLAQPLDAGGHAVAYAPDPLSASILPELPTYAVVNALADHRQHRGYYFAFSMTTNAAAADTHVAFLSPDVVAFMQTNDFVMTFFVNSFLPSIGGVRVAVQEVGFNQVEPLCYSVFSSVSTPRQVNPYGQYAYAIGLLTQASPLSLPLIAGLQSVDPGTCSLRVEQLNPDLTTFVSASSPGATPWQTSTVFVATGQIHSITLPLSGTSCLFRVEQVY